MQAYGNDRVRIADDGRIVLSSRLSKGWKPCVPADDIRKRRAGTAVLWEEAFYEVVEAEAIAGGGVRYVLGPWREEEVMRVSERYDAESEAQRIDEHRKHLQRESKRKRSNALGFLTGHLPAIVQQEMAHDLGIIPTRLTMISAAPLMVICGAPMFYSIALMFGGYPPLVPVWSMPILGYLTVESFFRFVLAFLGKPLGSLAGLIVYSIYHLLAPKRETRKGPLDGEKGSAIPIPDTPEEFAKHDAFIIREPLFTLLPVADQRRALERYDYDYRKHAYAIAIGVLIFSVIGIASSFSTGAVVAGIVAIYIAAEQIYRLIALRNGPTPSLLGFIVRPFVRKLLA